MSPRVCGLDLSITSTGLASIKGGLVATERFRTATPADVKTRTTAWYRTSHDRMTKIADRAVAYCDGADLVVIEGPSLHAKGSSVDRMFGMWWIVTRALHEAGIPYAVVAPTQLKKYMTGSGGAGKDAVLAAVIKRLPGDVSGNDEADALAAAAMGADYLGYPVATLPQAQRAVLALLDWPADLRLIEDEAS